MNTFNNQNFAFFQSQLIAVIDLLPGYKIKGRHINLFAIKKSCHGTIKEVKIHGPYTFKVVITILILRSFCSLLEEIIHGNRIRIHTQSLQLNTESV